MKGEQDFCPNDQYHYWLEASKQLRVRGWRQLNDLGGKTANIWSSLSPMTPELVQVLRCEVLRSLCCVYKWEDIKAGLRRCSEMRRSSPRLYYLQRGKPLSSVWLSDETQTAEPATSKEFLCLTTSVWELLLSLSQGHQKLILPRLFLNLLWSAGVLGNLQPCI